MFRREFEDGVFVLIVIEKSLGQPEPACMRADEKEQAVRCGNKERKAVPIDSQVRVNARHHDIVVGDDDRMLDKLVAMVAIPP